MKRDVLGCVCAALLGAAIVVATPAIARGGFGGGGHFGGFGPRFTGRSVALDHSTGITASSSGITISATLRSLGRRFFAFGAWPYYYDYAAYGGCWRQVWTGYGYQWTNICNDYGYYGY
jgi:hypothetical protein